ncbi:MAG: hypothetical protein ABEI86_01455 [Halobacteriaceae archaeon]
MARDFADFESTVNNREQFYDEISIETIAVQIDEEWINVHTDLHLQPEESGKYYNQRDSADSENYFQTAVSFEKFTNLINRMVEGEFEGHEESIQFVGLSNNSEDDSYWRGNIYNGSFHPRYGDLHNVYQIKIQANENPYTDREQQIEKKLKRSDPPYRNLGDLVKSHLSHTSFKWNKPQIEYFAPLYIQSPNCEIDSEGNFHIEVKSHNSIEDIKASTWATVGNEKDRKFHGTLNQESREGVFKKHSLTWELERSPEQIYYSLFPSEFDEIQGKYGQATSDIYKVLSIILDLNLDKLTDILDRYSTDRNQARDDKARFGNDFEAYVITLFNLGGFTAFSPEWFKDEANIGSLPDVLAFAPSHNSIIICECTTSPRVDELKGKATDAQSAVERVHSELDRVPYNLSIVSACATPMEDVTIDSPEPVSTLTGDRLRRMRELGARNADPSDIVAELALEEDRY